MKTLSTLCLQGMLECHYLSMECGSFWGLLFVPLDLLQDSTAETWGNPKHLERVVEPASSSITSVCPPENPRRPSHSRAGGSTLHQHSCVPQRRDHWALTASRQEKFPLCRGTPTEPWGSSQWTRLRIWPIKMSSIQPNVPWCFTHTHTHPPHKHHSPLTSGPRLPPLLCSPSSNTEAPQGQGSVFSSKSHKQQEQCINNK